MKLKKILAMVLCVAMVLGTMGTVAFAADDDVATVNDVGYTDIQEAIKAATPDGTVELLSDVTVNKWIMFAQNLSVANGNLITLNMDGLTINGNGHTLTVSSIESAGNGNRLFSEAQNLNINNLTIKCADAAAKQGGISLQSGTISNVTFDGGVGVLPGTGDITITGCTFKTSGSAIYSETDRDNLKVTNNKFETADGQYAIYLRGNTTFTGNTVVTGKVNVVSGSPVVTGNDFGEERFKVYNEATATIEDNTIDNLVFNDATATQSTFGENTMSDDAQAALDTVTPVEVSTYYELLEALEGNAVTIIMMNDIVAEAKSLSNAYGATGINILNGETLDGNGHTLTLSGLNGTWDSAINITGGTIKNLTVNKGFRGIFINHNSTYSAPVILENVIIDGPVYTISCDQGTNNGLTATGCTFNGWTSFAATLGKATFNNCNFGEGSGYSFCRPYVESEFNDCDFEKDYEFDANQIGTKTHEFNRCKYDGKPISAENGMEMFSNGGNIKVDDEPAILVADPVASIGLTTFASLEKAVEAVKDGNVVINLLADATLDYRNESSYGSADTNSITINGNGHTLTLNQKTNDGASIGMTNDSGVFKLENITVNKGPYPGLKTWNNHSINFKSEVAFSNVTFNNAIALYADATLNDVTVNEAGDYYAIWVSARGQDVTINGLTVESGRGIKIDEQYVDAPEKVELTLEDATFTTAKKAAIVVKSAAGAEIEAGDNIDISKVKEDTVNLVWIDEDAAKAGYTAPVTVNGEGAVVESAIATDISVSFVETENAGVYDIVLKGNNGDIYEFVGAELTFNNTSTTVGTANKTMEYAILGINGVTNAEKSIETDDEGNYKYALRLVDTAKRAVVDEITIGQVVFYGQGNINFGVSEGKVVTTEYGTNLGQYYTLDNDDATADSLVVEGITGGAVKEVTRAVSVNVAYNHALNGAYWVDEEENAANQITVTLKDGFGNVYGPFDVSDKIETIPNVKLGRLTVTLEAPGFRKYVYNTTLEAGADENDALVLNFWNEVKRDTIQSPLAEIEEGKGSMATNFLVGDIVMDMIVDEYDLAAVTSYYGTYEIAQADADKYIKYDLNRDGNIDIIDVHYVLHTLGN